jgi:hypothetical protein
MLSIIVDLNVAVAEQYVVVDVDVSVFWGLVGVIVGFAIVVVCCDLQEFVFLFCKNYYH